MKKKELKNLAQKIANCEYIIETSDNQEDIQNAQNTIMQLSSKVHDFQDLDLIDEMVQDILRKKSLDN